jgi:predicted glycosyltransferase
MPTLFYAINGVGLGHIARLSILEAGLLQRGERCTFFSPCSYAPAFFQSPGTVITESIEPGNPVFRQKFKDAVQAFSPDTVVCDTYWPGGDIGELKRRGVRTILILRLLNRHILRDRLNEAQTEFCDILIPHSPHEVAWMYREDPALLQQLANGPFNFIGPLCRQAPEPGRDRSILFTLGGGGEQYNPGVNTRANILGLYREAALAIKEELGLKPVLLAGPLLPVTEDLYSAFEVIRGKSHEYTLFGPNTVVVSRGGYNTVWEAIYAGSPLILCGSYSGEEDIVTRCDYLQHDHLASFIKFDARALVHAIKEAWLAPAPAARRIPQINCGLELLADNIAKRLPFRGQRRPEVFNVSGAFPAINGSFGQLVARFDYVDKPAPGLFDAIQHALDLGYRAQLHFYADAPSGAPPITQLLQKGVELWMGGTRNDGHTIYNGQLQARRSTLETVFHCRVAGVSWPRSVHPSPEATMPALRQSFIAKAPQYPEAEVCVDAFDSSSHQLKNELKVFGELLFLDKRVKGLRFPADGIPPHLIEYALCLFARPV